MTKQNDASGFVYLTTSAVALCGIVAGAWSLLSPELSLYVDHLLAVGMVVAAVTVGVGVALAIGARFLPVRHSDGVDPQRSTTRRHPFN